MFVEVVDTRFEPYLVWVLEDYSRITTQFGWVTNGSLVL